MQSALLATVAAAAPLSAQSIEGGMQATLMIVEPVGSASVQASGLSLSRSGVLSMDTTSPVAGPTSQIVMVDVTDEDAAAGSATRVAMRTDAGERALVQGRATPVGQNGLTPSAARATDFRLSYLVRVGTARPHAADVRLHLRYLAVAGT